MGAGGSPWETLDLISMARMNQKTIVIGTEPVTTYIGMLWYDTTITVPLLKERNSTNTAWDVVGYYVPVRIDSLGDFPTGKDAGYIFYHTEFNKVYRWTGTEWVALDVITSYSDIPPSSPNIGDLWYSITSYRLYRWGGTDWIIISPTGLPFDYEIKKLGSIFIAYKQGTGEVLSENTDAQIVFQAVADDILTDGKANIYVRHGEYPDLHVVFTRKFIKIFGDGQGLTVLKPKSGYYALTFQHDVIGEKVEYTGYVEDLSINGMGISNSNGILHKRIYHATVKNVTCRVTGMAFKNEGGSNNRWINCIGEGTNGSSFESVSPKHTVTDEQFNSDGLGNWVQLDSIWIIPFCETVTNIDGTVTYTRDTDYEMDYLLGKIKCLSSGSMVASTNYLIDYYHNESGAVDMVYTDCMAQNSKYGFAMKDGSNGFQMTNCQAAACTNVCFLFEGNWSGGWGNTLIADSATGDAYVIKASTDHISDSLQLQNIWGRECNHGLVIQDEANAYTGGRNAVVYPQIGTVNLIDSQKTGLKITGVVDGAKVSGIIRHNNKGNNASPENCNVLIMNGPQQVELNDCSVSYCYGANRGNTIRVLMDTNSTRWTIVKFVNCTLRDDDSAKAKVGLKNTHGSYQLRVWHSNLRGVDVPVDEMFVVEAGSTGAVNIQMINYIPHGTSFPVYPLKGEYFYHEDENILYRYDGAWKPIVQTTGEGPSFPASPQVGDLFYITTLNLNALYRWNGSVWNYVHQLSTHGSEFPSSPKTGDFFYWTTNNYLYRYNGSSWIKVIHQENGSAFPSSPETGDTFYHTSYQQSFYYNGSSWIPLATICRSGTGFPASKVTGDIFYRTDLNEFYQYNGTVWVYLATADALTPETGQGENLISNADFERDIDEDNIPDFWFKYEAEGTGDIALETTDSRIGKQSIKIIADTVTSAVAGLSRYIRVDPNNTYYWETYSKPQHLNNSDVHIVLYGYNSSKTYVGEKIVVNNQSRDNTTWTKDSNIVTPATDTDFGADRALIRYMRIGLYCATPTTASAYVLFDEVIFSLQRAALPTEGVIATSAPSSCISNFELAISPNWTNIFTISPSGNTECYFIFVRLEAYDTTSNGTMVSIKATMDGQDYPLDAGLSALVGFNAGSTTWLLTIPQDVNGKTITIKGQANLSGRHISGCRYGWGHSPHSHR